tara:strand:+ start:2180 stop:3088 length:909 start_codon:yes stop_codon:yes gene_type:complete
MDKLQNIRIFIEVAKQQSFSAAAEVLALSAPATTRSIAALENHLGVKLFNRTTRLVRLTEAGARFLQDAKRIIDDLEQAEAAVIGVYKKPSGTLTITAPVLFGEKHIIPIVTEYLKLHPNVAVKAMLFDRVTNLLEEKIDIAIRIGHLKDSGLYASEVGKVRRIVCAAPSYFDAKGRPNSPIDLADHEIIFPTTFETTNIWQFHNQSKKEQVKLTPRLHCNQNAAALSAVISGHGISRLMSYQIGEELENGKLQSALTEFEEPPLPINVIHVEGRRANAKIRAFVDLTVERLRSNPFINPKI